jgi:PKD repeat protein
MVFYHNLYNERQKMIHLRRIRYPIGIVLGIISMVLLFSACNLGANNNQVEDITSIPTNAGALATRTLLPNVNSATVTPIPFPTRSSSGQIIPTSSVILPPVAIFPSSTPAPISIFILSPTSGNIVAGNIQVLGSASHPQFLQYRLEYGPDPNPSNLWFPITGIVQTPIISSTLGIWNTTTPSTPDGIYQLRLRVFLRDGRQETTTVNNIRIQNTAPTPIPTSTPSTPRPIAAFTQDVSSGNAPLVVRFTNQSQGQISGYTWFFGDGTTSSETNPTHTFRSAGVYTVTLQVTGPGGTSNVSRQTSVTGINPPIASFITDKSSGPAPLTVVFTNQSSGNITGYTWDFGDGQTNTQTSPTYTFNTVGTYNVILEARGQGGTSRVIRQITVSNPQVPAPVSGFTPSVTSGNIPLTVTFTNTTTGSVTQYLWDFNGDGVTDSTDQSPTHIFTTAGTYAVKLTAIGSGGQSSTSASINAQTPPNAPVANFTVLPASGTSPLNVQFTNTTTGDVTGYIWDFDNNGQPDSTETSPSFTYTTAGTYTARLTASGPGGSTFVDKTISVSAPINPPQAAFTTSVSSGTTPFQVVFTNTSQGDSLTFDWDFNGDGVTDSTDANPTFTYSSAGTFTATLKASNSAGTNTATTTITTTDPVVQVPPTAAFSVNPTSGTAPLPVAFTNNSVGDITTIAWDFETDGVVDSSDANPSFTYNTSGLFNVTLTVTNGAGSDSISQTITVNEALVAPIASFTTDVNTGTAPLTVNFTNASTGTVDSYSWDFQTDGTADSSDANPSFPYATAGTYTATLTVTNGVGSDSISQTITVNEALVAPIASFTTDVNTGTAPLTVNFTNTSTGTIDSYSWDFQTDGTADSSDANASFPYATAGTYTATLTVTNGVGSDSISQTITVNEALVAPIASFTTDVNTGTAPLTVNFTNTSTGTIDSYSWDFQTDGTADSSDANASFPYATAGTYTATLTVTNGAGSNTSSLIISVNPPAPVVTTIAFVSNRDGNNEIYLIADDGNGAQNLTNNGADDRDSVYSPDGSKIAFVSNRDGNDEIYVITIADSTVVRLTNDGNTDTSPTWSGDGSRLAFASNRSGNFDIWVMNADGTNPIQLTFDASNETQPSWSGSQIAYVSDSVGDNNIFIMNDDGSSATQLTTETNNDQQPNFANGKIVFTSDRSGDNDIWVMNSDGSGVTQLTFSSGNDQLPRWSGDNSTIVFTSDRDTGNNDVYRMGTEGSNQTNVTNNGANDFAPDRK